MGTWGPGLYSNDIARDLKSTIAAVVNLPFESRRLVEIVTEAFPEAANNGADEDYTTFWLVLADQLHRRGINCEDVFARAFDIIDSETDLSLAQHLEMGTSDLQKRGKNLQALRSKLCQPVPQKSRKTLKKPQPLLMAVGDVIVYPIVREGGCFNPYFAKRNWEQADWGAAVIIASGHAFDFLAYYCPIVINGRLRVDAKPTLELLLEHDGWRLDRPGTCSKTHYKRMELDRIAGVDIDPKRLLKKFPDIREGTYAAVNDISMANSLHVTDGPRRKQQATIRRLSEITRS